MFSQALQTLSELGVQLEADEVSVELPFLARVLSHVRQLSPERWQAHRWRIVSCVELYTKELRFQAEDVVIYIGNEDGKFSEVLLTAKHIFTPYLSHWPPPAHLTVIPLGYHGKFPQQPSPPLAERKTHVAFSGQIMDSRRGFVRESLDFLLALKHHSAIKALLTFTPRFQSGLSVEAYGRLMYDTQLALVPWGVAPVTFRFFEALRAGCIVVPPPLPPYPFLKNFPGIALPGSWEGLTEALFAALATDLSPLQARSQAFYREHCAPSAVAHQMIQALKNA